VAVESRNITANAFSSKFSFKPFELEKNGLKLGGNYFHEAGMSIDLDGKG
jgi:hypothetical protein